MSRRFIGDIGIVNSISIVGYRVIFILLEFDGKLLVKLKLQDAVRAEIFIFSSFHIIRITTYVKAEHTISVEKISVAPI